MVTLVIYVIVVPTFICKIYVDFTCHLLPIAKNSIRLDEFSSHVNVRRVHKNKKMAGRRFRRRKRCSLCVSVQKMSEAICFDLIKQSLGSIYDEKAVHVLTQTLQWREEVILQLA